MGADRHGLPAAAHGRIDPPHHRDASGGHRPDGAQTVPALLADDPRRQRADPARAAARGGPPRGAGPVSTAVRVFSIPLRTRFRGIDVREGTLVRGPAGWGEFSPFWDYT